MAQPVSLPFAHSICVFGSDSFWVKYLPYFVSAKSAKGVEHNQHCSLKSLFFPNLYTLRWLLLSFSLNKYKIMVPEIIKLKSFSVQKAR